VEPVGDPVLLGRAAEHSGSSSGVSCPKWSTCSRSASASPSSIRSCARRSTDRRRRTNGASRTWPWPGPWTRTGRRPPRMAPRSRGTRARRSGRLRARAVGGTRSGPRRVRGSGRLPARSVALTRDPAQRTARALAAAEASLRAGAFDDARRADRGGWGSLGRARERAVGAAARADRLRGRVGRRSVRALAQGRRTARVARSRAGSRELPRRLRRGGVRGVPSVATTCRRSRAPSRALDPPAGARRAIDVLLDGLALLVTEGRAAAAPTLLEATAAFAATTCPDGRASAGVDGDGGQQRALGRRRPARRVRRYIGVSRDGGRRAAPHLPHRPARPPRAAGLAPRSRSCRGRRRRGVTGTRLAPRGRAARRGVGGRARTRRAQAGGAAEASSGRASRDGRGPAEAILGNGHGRYADALEAARRARSPTAISCLDVGAAGARPRRHLGSATSARPWSTLDLLVATTRRPRPTTARHRVAVPRAGRPGRPCEPAPRGDRAPLAHDGPAELWPGHTCSSASGCAGRQAQGRTLPASDRARAAGREAMEAFAARVRARSSCHGRAVKCARRAVDAHES
jgi:hypothetical protein